MGLTISLFKYTLSGKTTTAKKIKKFKFNFFIFRGDQ